MVLFGCIPGKRDPDAITTDIALRYAEKLSEQTRELGFEVKYLEGSLETRTMSDKAFDFLGKAYLNYLESKRAKDG